MIACSLSPDTVRHFLVQQLSLLSYQHDSISGSEENVRHCTMDKIQLINHTAFFWGGGINSPCRFHTKLLYILCLLANLCALSQFDLTAYLWQIFLVWIRSITAVKQKRWLKCSCSTCKRSLWFKRVEVDMCRHE